MTRFKITLLGFLLYPLAAFATDPIGMDMEGRKEFLKGQFSETYFANLQTPEDERMAMDKTVIHVVAVAVAANASCGLDVDIVDLERKARQMGLNGPLARDFFAEIKDSVAKDIADQLADDEGGVCDGIYYTVEKALPLVRVNRSGREQGTVSSAATAKGASGIASSPPQGAPDVKEVKILFSTQTVRVPIRRNPDLPEDKGVIDYERMISDPQFDGQEFPDFVCPPSQQQGCELMYGEGIQQAKNSVVGRYEPTEELCRDARINVAMNGREKVIAGLNTMMFALPLVGAGPRADKNSEASLMFSPMIYHFIRLAMANQVCLGLRQL